jgi:hypothetical protein
MTLRIVTITKDNGYTLEADERILEKRTSYGETVTWELLIAKGGSAQDGEIAIPNYSSSAHVLREEARDAASAASNAQMRKAFAAGFAAFASALNT